MHHKEKQRYASSDHVRLVANSTHKGYWSNTRPSSLQLASVAHQTRDCDYIGRTFPPSAENTRPSTSLLHLTGTKFSIPLQSPSDSTHFNSLTMASVARFGSYNPSDEDAQRYWEAEASRVEPDGNIPAGFPKRLNSTLAWTREDIEGKQSSWKLEFTKDELVAIGEAVSSFESESARLLMEPR
jgi:hypothetical protein